MNRRVPNGTHGGVRGRENLFNFPSYSIENKRGAGLLDSSKYVSQTHTSIAIYDILWQVKYASIT